jgi:hypothetical protein
MDLYTLDFESPWDRKTGYTLEKMSTEDYVNDPRFRILMCSVKRNAEPAYLLDGPQDEIIEHLRSLSLHRHAVCAQNMMFDGLVLERRCGIIPKLYIDTLSMARPICGSYSKRLGLGHLAKFFKLGEKGDEVVRSEGKFRREDFTDYEWAEFGRYCVNDTELCYRIYQRMRRHARPFLPKGMSPEGEPWMKSYPKGQSPFVPFSDDEMRTIDLTMRMYMQPQLELSLEVLEDNLVKTREKKAAILADMEVQGITGKVLRSTDKFVALLESKGVDVPLKPSPTDLKKGINPPRMVPALSKTDEGFKQLQEDYADDLEITMLLNARISEKSTQEETRTNRLIHIRKRYPKLRVPISYCSAHTTRDGGTQGINLQNPPKVDKSRMRYAIIAPPGHVIVDADQAQIEARLVAVCAGQHDLVEQFARGEDVYSLFASKLFKREVNRKLVSYNGQVINPKNGKIYERLGDKWVEVGQLPVIPANPGNRSPDEKEGKVGKEAILGLGFEMGAEKFRITLAGRAGIKEPIEVVKLYVDTYRATYPKIPELWGACKAALRDAVLAGRWTDVACVSIGPEGILFPTGMMIHYPKLGVTDTGRFTYRRAKDQWDQNLFGGKVTENFIQKLARDIVFWQANLIYRETGYRHVLRAHDALAHVVPEDKAEEFGKVVLEIMSQRPWWLPDVPLLAELKIGRSYGDT